MQVVPVMKRIQGLIVQKGNPLNLTSISDLTNPKVRFINRQRGSGTRLLLDSLLTEKGLNPEKIKGYNNEEFTHSAVASTILANKANVGISVKNIALENKLGFIYLKDELFFLAMRKELAANKEVGKLISKIRNYAGITEGYKSLGAKVQLHDWI
jgi:molybdate-binding protein